MESLTLPARGTKPRSAGRTHGLDKGIGPAALQDLLSVASQYLDLVKLGWGTSVVTPALDRKLAVYNDAGVEVCLGGTLFELAVLQGRVEEYAAWLMELGISSVEVSDGTLSIPASEKLALIERLSSEFTVYSEVGSKDAEAIVAPARWLEAIRAELDAGVSHVILEGRESGTAGLYRQSGEIRMGLIQEIMDAGVPAERLIFEAPRKAQQVWLIRHLGHDVNLGNIPLDEVIPLETLRLGLRGDTMLLLHGGGEGG
jgi:phosphosulfolactate synthase